jgi:hypothetical protein
MTTTILRNIQLKTSQAGRIKDHSFAKGAKLKTSGISTDGSYKLNIKLADGTTILDIHPSMFDLQFV